MVHPPESTRAVCRCAPPGLGRAFAPAHRRGKPPAHRCHSIIPGIASRHPFVEFGLPEPPQLATKRLSQVLEDVPADDQSWWPFDRVMALRDAMHDRHELRVGELLLGKRDGVATMYRRVRQGRTVGEVRDDSIAGCLRTANGGSSVQFLVDCRSGQPRIRPLTGPGIRPASRVPATSLSRSAGAKPRTASATPSACLLSAGW